MSVNSIVSGVQGLAYSLTFTTAKRIEDSVKAGENAVLTALCQVTQGIKAVDFANVALNAAGKGAIAWPLRTVTWLTPILLAVAKKYDLVPESVRPALAFVQEHISTIFEIASVVACVAMIFFGHAFFGVTALVVMAIGYMDRKGILPENIRQIVHKFSEPLLIVTGLLFGGFIDRLFSLLNIAAWGARLYLSHVKKQTPVVVLPENNLDHQRMQEFLNGQLIFSVNRKHIHANALPPIPDIDIEVFLQQFDQINWAQHIRALREKYRQDPRFIERHRNPDLKTDPEILAIAKETLNVFIHSVKDRRILAGEPVDYDKLHNYLKIIAKYVQDQPNEVAKADVLMSLAVDGGEYCGPGKFEAAESLFAQVISDASTLPLRDKVLHCLQDERNRWMQNFYVRGAQYNPVFQAIDWRDIHMYNSIVNCYGDHFGLRKTAAENDAAAIVDPLMKVILMLTLQKFLDKMFWRDHQLGNLIQTLIPSIGTPQLPKPEIYAYWQGWIERQTIPDAAKQELRDQLGNGMLYNRQLEGENGHFNPRFIALMLFDMGLLEINTAEEAAEDLAVNALPALQRGFLQPALLRV